MNVIITIEPSKELSSMLGFPYFIERVFPLEELLEKKIIDDSDILRMRAGEQIRKELKIKK